MTSERDRIAQALRSELVRADPPALALLFGSAARNRLRADSDVDVAFLPQHDLSLGEELALEARLHRVLGREVDLVRIDKASPLLRWEIARNHVVLVADPPGALPRFLASAALEHAEMKPLYDDARRRLARRLAGSYVSSAR